MLNVSIPAEPFFYLGPVPVTDAFLNALLITVVFGVFSFAVARRFSIVPTRVQVVFEAVADVVLSQLESAFGDKNDARKFFPLFATILLFVTIANQFTLVPLVTSVTYEGTLLLRLPTSDLSATLALALIMVVLSHVLALSIAPLGHIGNFIKIAPFFKVRSFSDFFNAAIGFFLGIMDIIGEFSKVISLACRLFGNMFAGNVMVAVIVSLSVYTSFLVPIPFLALGIFSGFVQAFVFMLLTMQFMAGTVSSARAHRQAVEATA
ncbi:F0F1 ATP synthase subunit A [Patescibacteria group bacterium]|nr:F0F1 ATP synthase subunit A [Patescibacteria group bacterium]